MQTYRYEFAILIPEKVGETKFMKKIYNWFSCQIPFQYFFGVWQRIEPFGQWLCGSDTWSPRFESSHQQMLNRIFPYLCQLYWKDGNKEKEARNGPFRKWIEHLTFNLYKVRCSRFVLLVQERKMILTYTFDWILPLF